MIRVFGSSPVVGYMEEAAEADYVVIIDGGKIVASDTPNNLKNQYAYDFVKIYNYSDGLTNRFEESSYTPRKNSKNRTTKIRGVIREKKKVILSLKYIFIFRSTI